MNLQPLFGVKDRLEHCAVAGTGLLEEDFRLRRAVDGLAPLASASPVFAKISTGLSGLLAASPEERGGLLLDVLALVDAVAYTQGITQAEGEWEPIVPHGDAVYIPLPYSRLKPILTALTTTGSGRLEVLRRAWEEDPQLLRDSRIMAALVGGLGDTYGEMGDLAAALQGAVVKDEDKDKVSWNEHLENVMKKRGHEWLPLYKACKELNP